MKTVKELKEALQKHWDEYNAIKDKAEEEKRDLTSEEFDRGEEILEIMPKIKRELAVAEKEYEVNGYMESSQATSTPPHEEIAQEGTGEWNSYGEYLQAIIRADSPVGSFVGGQPSGRIDRRLINEVEERAVSGMSEGIGQFGGFLLQQDYSDQLIQLTHQTGILAAKTFKLPISQKSNSIKIPGVDETSRATGSRWGGIRVYHSYEAETKTASKPKIRVIELGLNKIIGMIYLTDELIEDTVALEAWVKKAFSEEFGFVMDDDIINGTGVGMALGILNANCLVSVSKETGQKATTFLAENCEKMYARMYTPSAAKAIWYINQDVWPQIFQLHHAVGTGGVPMFIPAGELSKSPNGTLLGRPIQPIEQCQTLGTKGDVYLADLGQYVTADKNPMTSASSIHVKFTTDELALRFNKQDPHISNDMINSSLIRGNLNHKAGQSRASRSKDWASVETLQELPLAG